MKITTAKRYYKYVTDFGNNGTRYRDGQTLDRLVLHW